LLTGGTHLACEPDELLRIRRAFFALDDRVVAGTFGFEG
jgi:hypothetical protein